jgi:hypothetical protein
MKRSATEINRKGTRIRVSSRQQDQEVIRCSLCNKDITGRSRFDTHLVSRPHLDEVIRQNMLRERLDDRELRDHDQASIIRTVGDTLMNEDDNLTLDGDDDNLPLDDDDDDNLSPSDLSTDPTPPVTLLLSVRDTLLLGVPQPLSLSEGPVSQLPLVRHLFVIRNPLSLLRLT